MKLSRRIPYPIVLFLIGFFISSWGIFYSHASFWKFVLLWITVLLPYLILRPRNAPNEKSRNELENTIKLLKQSELGYSKLIEYLPVPAIIHSFGLVTYVNKAALKVLGEDSNEQLLGQPIYRFIDLNDHKKIKTQFQKVLNKSQDVIEFEECGLLGQDGRKITVESSSVKIQIDGYNMILSIFHDVTYRKKEEEMIRKMAYYCPLTQLPNRRYFEEILNKKMMDGNRSNQSLYILFIDLDGFKKINDSLGHDAGDVVLQVVSQRLTHSVRSGDFVSRFAGDEFIILLSGVQEEDAINICKRIILSMESPMIIKGELVYVTASIGISRYPHDGDNAQLLIKGADEAMYLAKQKGKNTFQFFQAG